MGQRGEGGQDRIDAAGIPRLTRGELLRAAGVGAAELLVLAEGASASPRRAGALAGHLAAEAATAAVHPRSFRTRPDLRPPAVRISGADALAAVAEGYLFLAPTSHGAAQAGPLIVDARGEPIWFRPVASGRWATNFRVQGLPAPASSDLVGRHGATAGLRTRGRSNR
jgi:hypothetical protein